MATGDIIFLVITGFIFWSIIIYYVGVRKERASIAQYLKDVQENTAKSEYHSKATSDWVGHLSFTVARNIGRRSGPWL